MYPHIREEHTHVARLLADFAKIDKPTIADFAAVGVRGEMYDRLDKYRMQAMKMSEEQIKSEKHRSARLARHMVRAGDPRPSSHCDCHAIVSGGHQRTFQIRALMAWLKVRIDDPHNGCWLPKDWDDRKYMPNYLRNGVPHRRIHHGGYYRWLSNHIRPNMIKTTEQLLLKLRMLRSQLQSGSVPPDVMPKTGR
ncbi:AHH domain-containing protein [Aliikangiella sp. IMCC44359]|uniref:AHH domain-containing protein n=1 Tax=Aliikangiella sp. IMCC44359 TaxID=3459125 RepID=UPI00403A8F8A